MTPVDPRPSQYQPFIIQAAGEFAPEQVRVIYERTPRPTTPALEASIAQIWEEQTALSKTDGRLLFNGGLLRYIRHEVTEAAKTTAARGRVDSQSAIRNSQFCMTVGPSDYRDFVGTNLYNRHRVDEFGWDRFSNPIGTTGTILTSDGMICYGLRSARVSWHANHVHTFGGALEIADMSSDGQVDTFASLRRELHEELGLGDGDIERIICTGLIRDKEIHQPELLFDVQMRMTASQVQDRWRTAEARDEHSAIVTLADEPGAIDEFVRTCGPIAPVAVGALHLHVLRQARRG